MLKKKSLTCNFLSSTSFLPFLLQPPLHRMDLTAAETEGYHIAKLIWVDYVIMQRRQPS
jgi:hypothetical protein